MQIRPYLGTSKCWGNSVLKYQLLLATASVRLQFTASACYRVLFAGPRRVVSSGYSGFFYQVRPPKANIRAKAFISSSWCVLKTSLAMMVSSQFMLK